MDELYTSVGNTPLQSYENTKFEDTLIKTFATGFYEPLDTTVFPKKLKERNLDILKNTLELDHISYTQDIKRICGGDDRKQASSVEYPYRMICRLIIEDSKGVDRVGTGFFISKRCVITCGHCVYPNKAWAKRITVIPGAEGNHAPFGQADSQKFRSVEGWVHNGDNNYDHGAVILPDNTLFEEIQSHFGYKNYEDEKLLRISGYPQRKLGTQWWSEGAIDQVSDFKLFYQTDTRSGNSGSPVFYKLNDDYIVVGVHSYGECPNSCVKVKPEVLETWHEWTKL